MAINPNPSPNPNPNPNLDPDPDPNPKPKGALLLQALTLQGAEAFVLREVASPYP